MFSKLTLLGKLLLMTTLIAYVITFLPLGITNVTIIVLLLANTVVFNTVVVVSIASNTDEWASFQRTSPSQEDINRLTQADLIDLLQKQERLESRM